MSDRAASSMRRDILSAYAVTAARVASWVMVSAVVFRRLGADALGILTLVRATVGILSYTSLGIGPAMVKLLADGGIGQLRDDIPLAALAADDETLAKPVLAYASGVLATPLQVYRTGIRLAIWLGALGVVIAGLYAIAFGRLYHVPAWDRDPAFHLVLLMGAGTIMRLISDAPSGLLQARGRIALDNSLLASAELGWGVLTCAVLARETGPESLEVPGAMFALMGLVLMVARVRFANLAEPIPRSRMGTFDFAVARRLLGLGTLIVLAQAADFLYAPTDCILINQLMGPEFVAYYSPAIQIDAGLLLLVSGLAAVLYPRAAVAHAAGQLRTLRNYYQRGTLVSAGVLLAAAVAVWGLSGWMFLAWFGNPMNATRAILPLVMVHTVIGGSSAVGRSILLGMGKAKAFTISVLIAGASNVVLSFYLVKYVDLGLAGIVMGTIAVVFMRCAVWMPWYVVRTLRRAEI